MARRIVNVDNPTPKYGPALTPEAQEAQMVAAATNLAYQQLMDGTASSQVIVHYLRLGTQKEKLEQEKLKKENELLIAKTEAYQSAKNSEELFAKAIDAMRSYSGGLNEKDN